MGKVTASRSKITVAANGKGLVGHAGTWLLTDLADVTGLTGGLSQALISLRQRDSGHDPGRVAVDVAVMLADGGEAISDLAVLRDQPELFGAVASDPAAWRVLAGIDEQLLARVRAARAAAREAARAQLAEVRGGLPGCTAAGLPVPGVVIDTDASIVICHSEKQNAAPTWKKSFGYYPISFSWTTREKPWPGCYARETPAPEPPPTTSRSSIWLYNRYPTRTVTVPTF